MSVTPLHPADPNKIQLVSVIEFYNRYNGTKTHPSPDTLRLFIKRLSIEVVTTIRYARGFRQFMTQQQADALIVKQAEDEIRREEAAPNHLGVVESKLERLTETVNGLTQALNVVISSQSLNATKLGEAISAIAEMKASVDNLVNQLK